MDSQAIYGHCAAMRADLTVESCAAYKNMKSDLRSGVFPLNAHCEKCGGLDMSEPKILNPVTGRLAPAAGHSPAPSDAAHPIRSEGDGLHSARPRQGVVEMKSGVGAAIRELREAKGLSQRVLADKLGIALASLNRWEKGKVVPNNASLGILDDYFESDLERRFGAVLKTEMKPAEDEAPFTSWRRIAEQTVGGCVQKPPTLALPDGQTTCLGCPTLRKLSEVISTLLDPRGFCPHANERPW